MNDSDRLPSSGTREPAAMVDVHMVGDWVLFLRGDMEEVH